MNLEDRKKKIPEEFKLLAQDFSEKGFITTSLDKIRKENVTKTFPELFEIDEVQRFAVALGHISAS